MKTNFGIGKKVIIVAGAIFVLFAVGLAAVVVNTSLNNLTEVKQAELDRMSQILSRRVKEMERNAVQTVLSFEESEPIVSQIELLTNLGPYYADPGSYVAANFKDSGAPIENADKIYTFQSQLSLIEQLRPVQRLNNFTSISFYTISPFNLVPGAKPVLNFRLNQDGVTVNQFNRKANASDSVGYSVSWNQFQPPPPEYFDISSAYSANPEKYYTENHFTIINTAKTEFFSPDWQETDNPHSHIIIKDGIPIIQTWYPVKLPTLHPETWASATVPVGLAVIEQNLDAAVLSMLNTQLGLNVGFAQDGQLLESTLAKPDSGKETKPIEGKTLAFGQDNFYYAQREIEFTDTTPSGLIAVVLSPASELELLNQKLSWQIIVVSLIALFVNGLVFYLGVQSLVSQPLKELMRGAKLIAAGDLSQTVQVQSQDELGQLAAAFNSMADELRKSISSLEQKVAARTKGLEIVNTLGERFNSILDFDQLLNESVNQVKEQFNYYHAQVYMLDSSRQNIVMVAGAGEAGAKMKAAGHKISFNAPTSLVARAARTGEIVMVADVYEAEDWLPNPLLSETRSEMAIPILLDDQVVGVLDVQENEQTGLDEGDAYLLRSLANQVAVAIRNARLFDQVESALAEAHAAQERYLEQAWQKTKIVARRGQHCYIQPGAAPLDEITQQAMDKVKQQAVETAGLVVMPLDDRASAPKTLVAPVILREKMIGAVQLCATGPDQPWNEDDLDIIETIIDQLAQTAESLRLFEETHERANFERTVAEITQKIRQAPNLETLTKVTAETLSDILGASGSGVKLGFSPTEPPAKGGNGYAR